MTKLLQLAFELPAALQKIAEPFSQDQLSKYGTEVLQAFAKCPPGTYFLDNKTIEFMTRFIVQQHGYHAMRDKKSLQQSFTATWLISGMLSRQLEIQESNQLTSQHGIVDNEYTRILYKVAAAVRKPQKIFKAEAVFYTDAITVALENMQFIKQKFDIVKHVESHPEVDSPYSATDISFAVDHYCGLFEGMLVKLFSEFKLPTERSTYEKIGRLLLGFPFVAELRATKQTYNYAIIFLYGCLVPDTALQYRQDLSKKIANLYMQDRNNFVMLCLKLLINNQSRKYANHVSENGFRMTIFKYLLKFLSSSNNNTDVINVLSAMSKYFDATSKAAFGRALAKSIVSGVIYSLDILFRVYDARLGLRDSDHLLSQMRAFAQKYCQDTSLKNEVLRLVPDDSVFEATFIDFMQHFDLASKRLLACASMQDNTNLNSADCVTIERYIFNVLKSLRAKNSKTQQVVAEFFKGTDVAAHNLSLALAKKLQALITSMTDKNVKHVRIKIKFFTACKVNDVTHAYVHKILFGTVKNLSENSWVLSLPDMPQEYIRFDTNTSNSLNEITRYLIDCSNIALARIDANRTAEPLKGHKVAQGVLISAQELQVRPIVFRRSRTPELPLSDAMDIVLPFRRTFSTPQFGPSSGWF